MIMSGPTQPEIAEPKTRHQKSKEPFTVKSLLTPCKVILSATKSFIRVYMWSVALSGWKTYRNAVEKRRLEAFQIWYY